MSISIHSIPLGVDRVHIIRGDKTIMIDGGMAGQAKNFAKAIEKLSIKPEDIKLIVLTHGDWDHVGSVKEIKDLTGARIALHQEEKDWLEKSMIHWPPGVTAWGKMFDMVMKKCRSSLRFPAAQVDISLGNGGLSLAEYGIPGKIIHTPGHTGGSVSVLLETGEAFVGDLAMSGPPLRLSPGLPIFADDMKQVRESWKLLIDAGAKTIYPAHGKSFSVDVIKRALR